MKIKPDSRGGVVMELGAQEAKIPSLETALSAFHLKKILVPVDFSERSGKALQYAICFAEQFQAELMLLHVVQTYPIVPETGALDIEWVQSAWEDLEALRRSIPDSVKSQALVRRGEISAEIIDAAEELDIDLVILSTRGRTGFEHFLFGSASEKVLRRACCPVLVLREPEHEFIVGARESGRTAGDKIQKSAG